MAHMARVQIVKTYVLRVFVNLEENELAPNASDESIEDVAAEILWDAEFPEHVKVQDASVDYAEVADRWEEA